MIKSILVLAISVAIASGASSRLPAAPVDRVVAGAVRVTVNYKGSGKVDSSHRVWVWLFETPNIGPGAMPIAELSVEKTGEDRKSTRLNSSHG